MGIFRDKKLGVFRITSILIVWSFIMSSAPLSYALSTVDTADTATLSPALIIGAENFRTGVTVKIDSENASAEKVDTLDGLKAVHPDIYEEIAGLKKTYSSWVRDNYESVLQDQPKLKNDHSVVVAMKGLLNPLEERIQNQLSKTVSEGIQFTAEELSEEMSQQKKNNEKLFKEISDSVDLSQKQKGILSRWLAYSLKTQLPLATIEMTAQQRAQYYARMRAGFREIMTGVIAYSKMLKNGEVNPDAVQLRYSPNDEMTDVRIDKVKTPDGKTRRANITSFPGKDDPKHLGHIIAALNGLVDGKTDKMIMLVDNFDYRKASMTSLVLREAQAKWGAEMLNALFGKEVAVYSPWMSEDRTLAPDGEHVLPLIIEHNFKANRLDVVYNAVWRHLAGGDHQHFAYSDKKDAGLDTISKITWIKNELIKKLKISDPKALKMGINFNGRPGEVASKLLTKVQEEISGLIIISSVQGLQVSSTEVRDNYIWALLPLPVAQYLEDINSPRWQLKDSMAVDYEKGRGLKNYIQQQEAITAKVIAYTKEVMDNEINDPEQIKQKIAGLLAGADGIGLQEIDRFISSIRDALLRAPQGSSSIDLEEVYGYDYSLTFSDADSAIKRIEQIRAGLFDYVDMRWEQAQGNVALEGIAPKNREAIRNNPEVIETMISEGLLEFNNAAFMNYMLEGMSDRLAVEKKGFIDFRNTALIEFAI
ncbi:MAG: hypothetical protein KJ915_05820 [Candidatus Omnitrophica bacterium]|nr:hypothetical protein [Candidatus Omnitrophota bacterium]